MHSVFAMAGPAEAALTQAGAIIFMIVLLTLLAAAFGLFARSRVAALLALALALSILALFSPWEVFRPVESEDPDVQGWVAIFQRLAIWWAVSVVGAVASVCRAFLGRTPSPAAVGHNEGGVHQ
jgi:hypothetical protein